MGRSGEEVFREERETMRRGSKATGLVGVGLGMYLIVYLSMVYLLTLFLL